MTFLENQVSGEIVDSCLFIHKNLGPGLLESVYERILKIELERKGLEVESQVLIPVRWRGQLINQGFRADLVVDKKVIVELKSVETLSPAHYKQILTYLKLTNLKVGLLINFKEALIKDGIHRIMNGYL
jgi:GxxExxY protein